jgi:hypothetical protein
MTASTSSPLPAWIPLSRLRVAEESMRVEDPVMDAMRRVEGRQLIDAHLQNSQAG